MSAQRTNRALKNKRSIRQREYEIIKRKAKNRKELNSQKRAKDIDKQEN
jgi:hypothetical protein